MTPEQIAGALTKAQRDAVLRGHGSHAVMISPEIEPLWYVITKEKGGVFRVSWRTLGLSVRAIIQASEGEG